MMHVSDSRAVDQKLESTRTEEPMEPISVIEFLVTHPNPKGAEAHRRPFSEAVVAGASWIWTSRGIPIFHLLVEA